MSAAAPGGRPSALQVVEPGPDRAAELVGVIHAGFSARPVLDPPATATEETTASVARTLAAHGGLLAELDGRPVGALLLEPEGPLLGLRRVAVHPEFQRLGVAGALVGAAERVAADRGFEGLTLAARAELPETVAFWRRLGYVELARTGTTLTLGKALPVEVVTRSGEQARELGERLAGLLRAGDLLILSGDLGAGKTTLTQGIGAGLEVRGDITSPTFVISRVHPSLAEGPPLVHVDAYRLGGIAELDDLDLDTALEDAVTVVEWGEGVAEGLADTRLEVALHRTRGGAGDEDDPRHLRFTPVGARWIGAGLHTALT